MPSSGFTAKELIVGIENKEIARLGSFTISPGEILALAGPNGAGKSTTIKTLARQLNPLSGKINLNDINIWDISARQFAQEIAYVPQNLGLSINLSVKELVSLGRNPHQDWWSWNNSQLDKERIDNALKLTNLSTLKDAFFAQLSGGEKQRALIAIALSQNANFILLDEPTAHLDFRYQIELAELLKDLRNNNLGVFVILHDLSLIASLADKVILLNKSEGNPSEVVAFGTADEVLQEKTLKEAYEVAITKIVDEKNQLVLFAPRKEHI
jgi:iron complex transport system ATP-binding protein